MTNQTRRALLLGVSSLIATTASGQEAYFRQLEIPPNSAGTCMPVTTSAGKRGSMAAHLLIMSVVPGQERDMSVIVDTLHQTVGYSEFESTTSARLGSNIGDVYVARFNRSGPAVSFAMHSITKMQVPDFKRLDSVSLRKIGEYSKTVSTRRPLSAAEQNRAREIAEWLRKRCPA
jgi:hypothetical protein